MGGAPGSYVDESFQTLRFSLYSDHRYRAAGERRQSDRCVSEKS